MGQILENGELQLTDEECEKLSLPPNSVVPVENVEDFQAKLQSMYDDDVKKLARQIGTKPSEEPYPGTLIEQVNHLIHTGYPQFGPQMPTHPSFDIGYTDALFATRLLRRRRAPRPGRPVSHFQQVRAVARSCAGRARPPGARPPSVANPRAPTAAARTP